MLSEGIWLRSYLNGLMVFPAFFILSLNLAIRISWFEPQSAPGLVFSWLYQKKSLSIFGCKEYNQSDFNIDHLVMSLCKVFSCVVLRGCLLWPVHSLGKTLLAFALLHSVFQGQICLLPQSHRVRHNWSDLAAAAAARCFLTSYFCIPVPYNEKDIFFGC